jgi:cell division protein FtsI (penicillin-binding protein 3)
MINEKYPVSPWSPQSNQGDSDSSQIKRQIQRQISRENLGNLSPTGDRPEIIVTLLHLLRYMAEKSNQPQPVRCPKQRLYLVAGLLFTGVLALAINLIKLQIFDGAKLKEVAQSQQTQRSHPFIPRRPIVDRHGNILAMDTPVYTLYAHPKLFKENPQAIADQLATTLASGNVEKPLTSGQLFNLFGTRESGLKIADGLPEDVANNIQNLGLDGLELLQHQQRLYPQKELASEIVGYVDLEGKGQAGVENSLQNLLERNMPAIRYRRSINGTLLPEQLATGFLQIDDLQLHLTLDSRLQRATRQALKKQMEEFKAKRGTVIVMDVQDGSLLSLVSEPSYDPNKYYNFDVSTFKNWAVTDVYEPGSTFKPLNVALALEVGAITPNTTVHDAGRIFIEGWPIGNADFERAGSPGRRNVTEIVKYSSNVGMVRLMQKVKPSVYYDGLKRLGLGDITGIDLPFETASILKKKEEFVGSKVEVATSAFGQGLSVTPIQLARLHATIANGGKLVTPHVVQGLYDSRGQAYWQLPLPTPKQVFSTKTSEQVLKMMEDAVTEGTGKAAIIPGYRIAGKTGTAQKVAGGTGYSKQKKIVNFVSMLPADKPRYLILVVIDEPFTGTGGMVAAPLAKTVMQALITLEKIPPMEEKD